MIRLLAEMVVPKLFVFVFIFNQGWNSGDDDDGSYADSSMRKRAVKIKHVKRREKRSEKKVKTSKYVYKMLKLLFNL